MKGFSTGILIAPKAERPFPEKEIIWGTQCGGQSRFPTIDEAWGRKHSGSPVPLQQFGRAIKNAQERVWIVDEYLLKPDMGNAAERIDQILEWLPLWLAASDIRLLTKHHQEVDEECLRKFNQREQEINKHVARREKECRIEVKKHLTRKNCNFIHDRFAIIDDELWHFGGTAGGFQSAVSAASRGWRAADHGATDFFERIWNAGERE